MAEIILFGGTSEGRTLCELLSRKRVPTLVCVATDYGGSLIEPSDTLRVRVGRLNAAAMQSLLCAEHPRLVIDATHPYAAEVSGNITLACERSIVKLIRLTRETSDSGGCVSFESMDTLTRWLNEQNGVIFSTLGAKEAPALTAVREYAERVWLRILPDPAGLAACLSSGFPAKHMICMQGPFSKGINAAMFRETGANILLTKESGAAGGFAEKLEAARECKMTAAVLSRPRAENGLTLEELTDSLERGAI